MAAGHGCGSHCVRHCVNHGSARRASRASLRSRAAGGRRSWTRSSARALLAASCDVRGIDFVPLASRRGCAGGVPTIESRIDGPQTSRQVLSPGKETAASFILFPARPRDGTTGREWRTVRCRLVWKVSEKKRETHLNVQCSLHILRKAIPSCPSPPIGTSLAPRWRRTRTRRT